MDRLNLGVQRNLLLDDQRELYSKSCSTGRNRTPWNSDSAATVFHTQRTGRPLSDNKQIDNDLTAGVFHSLWTCWTPGNSMCSRP
jgi:hypothetical protein